MVSVTASGSALKNQELYLYDSAGAFVEVGITGSSGKASFPLLKPDTYTVKVDYVGSLKSATATLTGGSVEPDVAVAIEF
jgi:hypothetical protein